MKVLTTPQFNEAVKQLSKDDQKRVYQLFELVSQPNITLGNLTMPHLRALMSVEEKRIYELRNRLIRVYCVAENIKGEDTLILIGVERRTSAHAKLLTKFVDSFLSTKSNNDE